MWTSTSAEGGGRLLLTQCRHCAFEWCWLCGCKYQQGHYRGGACEQFSQDFFDEIDFTREQFEEQFVVTNHW